MSRTRKRVLELAGFLGDGEAIPELYAEMPMAELVSNICSERDQTSVRIALIAVELAAAFDREHGV